MVRSPRRTTEGTRNVQASGSSATFTRPPALRTVSATSRFTCASSVAITTRKAPRRSVGRTGRRRRRRRPAEASAASRAVVEGLTTSTSAPHSTSERTLRSATLPPPTTRQRFPATSTIMG